MVITFTTYHGKWWNIVAFGAYIGFVIVVFSLSVSRFDAGRTGLRPLRPWRRPLAGGGRLAAQSLDGDVEDARDLVG